MCNKKKITFEDYKNSLQASQLETKIIHLNNTKIDVKTLTKNHKDFIINNKTILKS